MRLIDADNLISFLERRIKRSELLGDEITKVAYQEMIKIVKARPEVKSCGMEIKEVMFDEVN